MAETALPPLRIGEIGLASFTVDRLMVEVANADADEVSTTNTMSLQYSGGQPCPTEGGARVFSMHMNVSSAPSDSGRYYKIEAEATGVFAIPPDCAINDDDALRAIGKFGALELFNVLRSYISTVTSQGVFGAFMLPTIEFED